MITTRQREILEALIELYGRKKTSIKGIEIAEALKRTSGTIRNQMQTLHALGYVEGVPGPKGGYIPSMNAYEILNIEQFKKPKSVYVYREGKQIKDMLVQKILFSNIPHPGECRSVITVIGDTTQIKDGDLIKVGPTPTNYITLVGKVIGRDDTHREILIKTDSISSIPRERIGTFATRKLITVNPEMKITECARILAENGIEGVPVVGNEKLVGITTLYDIVRAFADGNIEGVVADVTVKDVLTIDKDAEIVECVKLMKKHAVGRLIITEGEKPVGIVTRTDIVSKIVG